jgi:ATP-binding cassette subfamily B protein
MDIIKRLAGMMKPYRHKVALALFLQLLVILTRLVAPFITRDIVNDVIPTQNISLLLPLCAALLGLVLLRALSTYIRSVTLERVSQNVTYDLRTGLYKHLQELPYVFYDTHRIGEIMSRMTGDIEGVRNLIAGGLITVYDNLLNFVGALIFLTFMSWQLTLALLIFAPLIALTAWQFNRRIRPAFVNIREQNAVLNTRTQENISGVRVVKAFTREDHESEEFDKDNTKLLNLHLEATRIWAIFVPLMELMSSLCTPIMLLVGGILLVNGQMDIGTLVAVNGYVWLIINPMRALSGIINMVVQAITSAANELGGKYLSDCTLYVTVEPCPMCAGALGWAQISRVVYGCSDPKRGFHEYAPRALHPKTQTTGGILEEECRLLMQDFFKNRR